MLDEQELKHRIKRFLSRKSREFAGLNYEFSGNGYENASLGDEDYDYKN